MTSSDEHQDDKSAQLELTVRTGPAQSGTMLPISEVARRLDCSLNTVRRMLKRDQLEGAQLLPGPTGQQWQVPLATVESLLAQRRHSEQERSVSRTPTAQEQLSGELDELRTRVQELESALELQRSLADERAHQLEQLHLTVRLALSAGQRQDDDSRSDRRRWWHRQ